MRRPSQPSSRRCNGRITLPQNNLAQRQLITWVMNLAHQAHTEVTRRRRQRRTIAKEGASSGPAKQFHTPALWINKNGLSAVLHPTLVRFGNPSFKYYDGLKPMHDSHPQSVIHRLCAHILQCINKLFPMIIKYHGNDFQRVLHVWHLKEQLPFTIQM